MFYAVSFPLYLTFGKLSKKSFLSYRRITKLSLAYSAGKFATSGSSMASITIGFVIRMSTMKRLGSTRANVMTWSAAILRVLKQRAVFVHDARQ